jgi:cellulose synthase/poly-beta-1,6-N-acetylglucosamine synthase-like glycosyltransferase
MKFSIIIPVKHINSYVKENLKNILLQSYNNYEVIILPNFYNPNEYNFSKKIKIISTGKIPPGLKRNIGAKKATGEVLVFFDDDSFPKNNFLLFARYYFRNKNINAAGGPSITPNTNTTFQKISGYFFENTIFGGSTERYLPKKNFFVDDWPSVNFLIKKKTFLSVGGFNIKYWPGEDTLFCLNLVKKTKKKILYSPNLVLYHHRRKTLIKHLKQIKGYGLHRGFFSKKYPENSLRFKYFVPSIFFLYLTSIPIALFLLKINSLYLAPLITYFFLIYFKSFYIALNKKKNISFEIFRCVFFSHIVYGYNFIKGLLSKNIQSKLN